MLNRLRNPGSMHRQVLAWLTCAALALHAFVPTGYMLGSDAATGELAVMLCPGQGALPADHPPMPVTAYAESAQHPSGHIDPHENDSQKSDACGFALAFAPLLPPTPSIETDRIVPPVGHVSDRRPVPVTRFAHSPLAARGPPHNS